MKYFSLNCVKNAYELVSANTKDKFWGILGILYSIDSLARPGVNFSINTEKLSNFLEQTFRLKDKKTYSASSSEYSVVFANDWEEKTTDNFIVNTPDIMPIIIWAYRSFAFDRELNSHELFEKFIRDFHLSKDSAEKFFNIKFDGIIIEYSDNEYDDVDLFHKLDGNQAPDAATIKMNKSFVVANAGDLSRGPFFQPLYASLNTLECLIIFPFDAKKYYQVFTSVEKRPVGDILAKTRQIIYYGAPGTGKSHKIKSEVDEKNKICYRTTFHPDSDYSTFVGAYKPSMEKAEEHLYNKEELISKLTELKEQGVTYSPQKFGAKYWYSLKGLSLQEKKDILTACDMSDNYTVEFDKGIAVGEELLKKAKESRIIYGFIPQAFTKAYVHAWNTKDEVYLVIEEINRGNCAQIFGDLFQLLDRKNGFSEYPIDADSDLESHIKEKLEKSTRDDIPELVREGKKLMLPSNLYIWATMNTSDQSLFPIDSAFKRRWDWVYTPIKQHDEEYKIVLGDETEYDWWGFLEKINQVIDAATNSEDKKLGYFFVKAQNKVICAEKFVGKVLFYLWNDVFKNYGFDSPIFSKGGNKKFAFSDFFTKSGEPEPEMVKAFLDRLDDAIDKENSFKIKNKLTGNSAETAEQA